MPFSYCQFLGQIVQKISLLLNGSQADSSSEVTTFKKKTLVLEASPTTSRIQACLGNTAGSVPNH